MLEVMTKDSMKPIASIFGMLKTSGITLRVNPENQHLNRDNLYNLLIWYRALL